MAVEYDISSDVAVIKETGSVSQCARVTQMYSGQITYDDEAGSKFATATINGKSQRVMLCIAVNGTVTYDDVPSLYSTVDGHRCLNIVTPTETGTPDDVPSLYETVVIDGQNVRAVRCIMINKTPVYDGVSSTCTFTGDDGKTHTAQLVNKVTGGSVVVIIKGTSPLNLPDAIANSLSYVKAFGGTEQRNLPDGYTQFGRMHFDGNCYFDTGIVINSYTATVKLIAAFASQTSTTPCIMWGFLGDTGNLPRWGTGIYQGSYLMSANATISTSITANTNKHTFTSEMYLYEDEPRWKSSVDNINPPAYTTLSPATILTNTLSIYIGARNNNGTVGNFVIGDFTYLEVIQDGVCLAKIYPCKRDSDNRLGLYNTVTNEFLTNLGTGTLTADIFATPTPSEPINIVSNNGVLKYGQYGKNLFDRSLEVQGYYLAPSDGAPSADSSSAYVRYISVKPNTKYTISFVYKKSGYFVRVHGYNSGEGWTSLLWAQDSSSGTLNNVITKTFTTGANDYYLGISYPKLDEDIQLEQGSTATEYEPYHFGIHTDGTVETIQIRLSGITPENFVGINATITKKIGLYSYDFSFSPTSASTWNGIVKSGINIIEGHKYYYCAEMSASVQSILAISFGSGLTGASKSKATVEPNTVYLVHDVAEATATISNNSMYIRCGYMGTGDYTGTAHNIGLFDLTEMFGAGNEPATADAARAALGFQTATAEMLLKVGDYQDVQSIIDGVVTRNVGVKVLDGTETWTQTTTNVVEAAIMTEQQYGETAICSHLIYSSAGSFGAMADNSFKTGTATYKTKIYCKSSMYATDTTSWTNYLKAQYNAGTPVIIIYPLATPTTESVAGQTLQVTDGDNVLEITQASLNGLELEVEYQAAVSLTIQEVQDANLDNNVTVTIQ